MITRMIQHIEKIKALALTVLETEAQAILALKDKIDDQFFKACEYLLACKGRIVVIGMGKSGHIASKLAATLASTGTPAFFVHPGEASHGDIGMITSKDVVLILSNSGETDEILTIAPVIKRLGIPLITLTGNPLSSLARLATINIDVSVKKEACPLGLAPTSSTTASLAMGDALAIALLQARGFTADDFARSHPGGILGRRLLLHIEDVMRKGEQIPQVKDSQSISEALLEMTAKNLGMTTIINDEKKLVGIYTDGDLRRTLDKGIDIHQTRISTVMTTNPKTLTPYLLAIEGIKMMEDYQITGIVVTDEENKIIGIVHMHDLLKSGVL
jgi:arabinose-5-phosphate isomerase